MASILADVSVITPLASDIWRGGNLFAHQSSMDSDFSLYHPALTLLSNLPFSLSALSLSAE